LLSNESVFFQSIVLSDEDLKLIFKILFICVDVVLSTLRNLKSLLKLKYSNVRLL